jgi:hypothetical protein
MFAGQISRLLELLTPARSGVTGLRFHAGRARALVGAPMSNATGLRVDLTREWVRRPGGRDGRLAGCRSLRLHPTPTWRAMKRVPTLAAISIALCATFAQSQTVDELAWLAGTWTQKTDSGVVQEAWLGPRAKMMVATNLTSSARRNSFEFLRIVERDGSLVYLASPNGIPPVEFRLKEFAPRRVVFENPTHDFPQRVLYWLEPDGVLRARIEGTMQGRERGIDWRFEREAAR